MNFFMSRFKLLFIGIICLSSPAYSQDVSADSLLAELDSVEEEQKLLPEHIFITQRLFWGEKGLLRTTKISTLNAENREKEMKIRRAMLKLHQVGGFVTLAGMIAQGIIGAKLYNNPTSELRQLHESMGAFVNVSYISTALLSFTAPPPLVNRKGVSSIKIHKGLAMVHLTGMIATNILAGQLEQNPSLKPYHRAAAYTTFVAFAAAAVVIKF
jgi:hypothetical protein